MCVFKENEGNFIIRNSWDRNRKENCFFNARLWKKRERFTQEKEREQVQLSSIQCYKSAFIFNIIPHVLSQIAFSFTVVWVDEEKKKFSEKSSDFLTHQFIDSCRQDTPQKDEARDSKNIFMSFSYSLHLNVIWITLLWIRQKTFNLRA